MCDILISFFFCCWNFYMLLFSLLTLGKREVYSHLRDLDKITLSSDRDWYGASPVILPKRPSQIPTEGNDKTQLAVAGGMANGAVRNWVWATGMNLFSFYCKRCLPSCYILVKTSVTKSSSSPSPYLAGRIEMWPIRRILILCGAYLMCFPLLECGHSLFLHWFL